MNKRGSQEDVKAGLEGNPGSRQRRGDRERRSEFASRSKTGLCHGHGKLVASPPDEIPLHLSEGESFALLSVF